MLQTIFETLSFAITVIAFIYGVFTITKKNGYAYFKFYFGAISCYMLEELWVLVNTYFGKNENMISIRLVAIYGCLCFILSGARHLDEMVDKNHNADENASLVAIIMPLILLSIYGYFLYNTFYSIGKITHFVIFFALSPAFLSSYYNFKHFIMKNSNTNYLKGTRAVNGLILMFFFITFGYMVLQIVHLKFVTIEFLDMVDAALLGLIILFSERGVKKWQALQ